ncbi:glycosyltransferase [Methanoculleus formosensis]|nr:glycosyltransferase [Methanoculleus sp. Afa-1]
MKILTITTWDSAGEQFNGYQIHKVLNQIGHKSDMSVMIKQSHNEGIHTLGNVLTRLYDKTFAALLESLLGLRSILPISGSTVFLKKYYHDADLIHLQIIHGNSFFSILNIPLMSRRHKVVWTIHDPWMMTGHCIYPLGCERWKYGCGDCQKFEIPFRVRHDSTALMWRIKCWIMHRSDVTLIVASKWMYDNIRASPILSHLPCHIIPLGIDLDKFRQIDRKKCREEFGIPDDADVLAFRFKGTDDHIKGWNFIKEALISINPEKPTYLLIFDGKGALDILKEKYNVIELGWSKDLATVIHALNAADIFLMPSTAEAFGMMAVESMACGTPVIVFDGTALPDVIHAPEGGISVPARDSKALADAITGLLKDEQRYAQLVENGLRIVREEYSLEKYIQRHIELYKSILCEE